MGGLAYRHSDTSVHGEGRAAIATQRLSDLWNQQPTTPPDQLVWYIAWATAHEIGHLFNIDHCGVSGCIMGEEVNVAGSALKAFCSNCRAKLGTNLP